MQITVDMDDYLSVLSYVRMLGRRLVPVLAGDLPALLGHRAPSGMRRVADAAARGRLHTGFARDMLPVIADACDRAIEDGISVEGVWIEVGWSDGGVDWTWHEWEVLSETAHAIVLIRHEIRTLIELLERIEDLVAAQRDVGELIE
ncbi:MAG: hypothetical protein H6896_07205 [Rhodovulum sp.]|nr:hypothetical protein [Paracoccaceae bacterium]MCC0066788.1 hypothetical protein [Rhodovulum sp.]